MRTTLVTTLVLAFLISALGGPTLAQMEAAPSPPSGEAAPSQLSEIAPGPSPTAAPAETAGPADPASGATLELQEPRWRKLRTGKGPAAREDHTWTVDGRGRYAYLFGGRDGGREYGDTWRYDLANDRWKRLKTKGRTPAPRFGHSAVWVAGLGVVVFAGQRGTEFFDDLWVLDPGEGRWRKLPAKGQVPKSRYGSCLVVGPDGRLWISHGFTDAGRFDDTRAYNLARKRWAVITPDGRKPGERCLHECFTSLAGELVLYGGQDDGNFALGDLWSMGRDRAWERQDDPPARWRRLYGVTEAGNVAYVFGGAGEDNANLADLWRIDRESLEFSPVAVEGRHPPARFAATLITDHRRSRLLLFGGQADSGARSDVWELVETAQTTSDAYAVGVEPGPSVAPAETEDGSEP